MKSALLEYKRAGLLVAHHVNLAVIDREKFGTPSGKRRKLKNRYQLLDLGHPDHELLAFDTNREAALDRLADVTTARLAIAS